MAQVFVLLQYNNDDNYDAKTIGVYDSKKKAINSLLSILADEYTEMMEEDDSEESLEEFIKQSYGNIRDMDWNDIKEKIKKNKSGDYPGFSYLNYKISKQNVK